MKLPLPKISLLTHIVHPSKEAHRRRLIEPVREWALGLTVSVVLFLILAGYAGFDFYQQSQFAGVEAESGETLVVYKERDVVSALEYYRTKEESFKKLRTDRSAVFVSPSPQGAVASTSEVSEPAIPLAEQPVAE